MDEESQKIIEADQYGYSCIAEVDLFLHDKFHDTYMQYPLLITKRRPKKEELSPLQLLSVRKQHARNPNKFNAVTLEEKLIGEVGKVECYSLTAPLARD